MEVVFFFHSFSFFAFAFCLPFLRLPHVYTLSDLSFVRSNSAMSGWGSSSSSSKGAYRPLSDPESGNPFDSQGSMQTPLLSSPSDILDQIQQNISELVVINAQIEKQLSTIGSSRDRRDTRQQMFFLLFFCLFVIFSFFFFLWIVGEVRFSKARGL